MAELESINLLDRCAIPELRDKNFFIPDYQRGYRWGETQIRQLLEDLYGFFYDKRSQGAFYCLQPVVVKQMEQEQVDALGLQSPTDNNVWYEVIDGQQRLTTIRIILALESLLDDDKDLSFNIHYQTRPNLGAIFDNLQKKRDENKRYTISAPIEGRMDIDTWHILQAANQIINWFQDETPPLRPNLSSFKGTFYENFSNDRDKDKSVQVIWYELRDDAKPVDIFKRLNDKCISLNNAELIRGMFLSDAAEYNADRELLRQFATDMQDTVEKREKARKQAHIIEQWDIIERELRNDQFWLFIHNESDAADAGYSCRIEYIFDLIAKKEQGERDRLYTYVEFDNMLKLGKVEDLWELWLKVETYFSYLKYWYNNHDYYHKIGYLAADKKLGSRILMELLEKASTLSTKAFNALIEEKIMDSITKVIKRGDPPKPILEYTYTDDYEKLKQVLFLYNVESTRILNKEKFPFNKYKSEKNWTLEHIHAQNSDLIDHSDKDKWVEWFAENERVLASLQKRFPENTELTELLDLLRKEQQRLASSRERFQFNDLKLVFDNVLRFFDGLAGAENRPTVEHGISNMALLSGSTNSAISNSVFEVKRQIITVADADGEYIPICTRNVFMKYYNKNQEDFTVQQNFYWSESDRINYLADIKRVLAAYLPKEVAAPKVETIKEESEVNNG